MVAMPGDQEDFVVEDARAASYLDSFVFRGHCVCLTWHWFEVILLLGMSHELVRFDMPLLLGQCRGSPRNLKDIPSDSSELFGISTVKGFDLKHLCGPRAPGNFGRLLSRKQF